MTKHPHLKSWVVPKKCADSKAIDIEHIMKLCANGDITVTIAYKRIVHLASTEHVL